MAGSAGEAEKTGAGLGGGAGRGVRNMDVVRGRVDGGGDRTRGTLHCQLGVVQDGPLDQGQGQRAQLEVAYRRTDVTDLAGPEQDGGTSHGELRVAAVEMEEHEPARGAAEVVDASNGLLTAVAALVEMNGAYQPADLLGERAVVGVQAEAGSTGGGPQRLVGHSACGGAVGHGQVDQGPSVSARQQQVAPEARRCAHTITDARAAGLGRSGGGPNDREVLSQGDLHTKHEAHPLQEGEQIRTGPWLEMREDLLAGLDQLQVVLDVPLRGQHQGLGRLPGSQGRDVLRQQRVQPGQPIRPGDPQHGPMGQVDHAYAGGQPALLEVGVTVVAGHTGVGRISRDTRGRTHTRIKAPHHRRIPGRASCRSVDEP